MRDPVVHLRVDRALFLAPERWHTVARSRYSAPITRRLENVTLFPAECGVPGEMLCVEGLPVRAPLPVNRTPGLYRVKAYGMEGSRLVVHLA